MKVLFVSNDPNIFSETSAVRERMRAYALAIGELHIVSRASKSIVISDGSLTLHGVEATKGRGWRTLARAAHDIITTHGIQIVSAQDPFEYGYVARSAVQGTSAKLHIQVHTDFLSPWFTRGSIFRSPHVLMSLKNSVRQKIAGRVLSSASGIRVVSERIKTSLIFRYGKDIVIPTVLPIVPSGILPEPVSFPLEVHPFTLVTVGRLEPEKRIEDIIEALAQVYKQYPMIRLLVIGEGRNRAQLEQLVSSKGLQGCVFFLGQRSDAWGLMRSAQGYIQASAYEGYGITLIEAALARVPIITTDVGVVGEVFTGYEDLLVTPPGDPANLASHIISLIEDDSSREVRARSAEAKALAHIAQFQNLPSLIASDLSKILEVSV